MSLQIYDRSRSFAEKVGATGGEPLRIAVAMDRDLAGCAAAQLLALAIVTLLPRISERYIEIDFCLPNQKVVIPRVRWTGEFVDYLTAEANAICPFGRFRAVRNVDKEYDYCIMIGGGRTPPTSHVIYAIASGWRCFVSESDPFTGFSPVFNPCSCLATAALAAAFVYRRAENIELYGIVPSERIDGWSLFDYAVSTADGPPLPLQIDVGQIYQAGLGGTGNALLWVLRYGPELSGNWMAFEHECTDPTNWNRYLLMKFADSGVEKTLLATRAFDGLHPDLHFAAISESAEGSYSQFSQANIILTTVDDPRIRIDLQRRSANLLLNVGTDAQSISVSLHDHRMIVAGMACVECLLGRCDRVPRRQREATMSFVLALVGAVLSGELIKSYAFPEAVLANSWSANVFSPESARVWARSAASDCETCQLVKANSVIGVAVP